MHEFLLINDLMRRIESAARENDATSIVAVRVRIGALAQISADHFREHFAEASQGTAAQNARLDIEVSSELGDPHACNILLESIEVAS